MTWVVGQVVQCIHCGNGTEAHFRIVTAELNTIYFCPRCMKQGAEACLLEAEAMGLSVPGTEKALADDVATPEELVTRARQELLRNLVEGCDSIGMPLRDFLLAPAVAEHLGVDVSWLTPTQDIQAEDVIATSEAGAPMAAIPQPPRARLADVQRERMREMNRLLNKPE